MVLKLVLFDIGGTLIDYPIPLESAGEIFKKYKDEVGLPAKVIDDWIEGYLSGRKQGFKTLKETTFLSTLSDSALKNNFIITERDMMNILEFLYGKAFADVASLIDGAMDLLSYIKKRGLYIGMISNTAWPGYLHEADLRRFGILNFFDSRIWTSEEGIRKPHKGLFLKALSGFGVDNKEAIYIGDTFGRDVVGPNSIGVRSIWISDQVAHLVFNGWQAKDLFEVKDILSKIP